MPVSGRGARGDRDRNACVGGRPMKAARPWRSQWHGGVSKNFWSLNLLTKRFFFSVSGRLVRCDQGFVGNRDLFTVIIYWNW